MNSRKPANSRSQRRRAALVVWLTASLMPATSVMAERPGSPNPARLPSVSAGASPSAGNEGELGRGRWSTAGIRLYRRASLVSSDVPVEIDDATIVETQKATPPKTNTSETPRFESATIQVTPASASGSPSKSVATRWLRSTTSTAALEVSKRRLVQASDEYNVGAWLSAETSAWDALQYAAEAVDLASREQGMGPVAAASAQSRLRFAKTAIHEARDFSGVYGPIDSGAIARMARSHRTNLLDGRPTQGLTGTDASDRYLDEARVALAPIAAESVDAAQAMDLLAAIYLSRADGKTLPSATALCLRRAALQGQPGNASLASRLGMHLADLGLYQEARWALEHSLSIQPDTETSEKLVMVLRRTGQVDQAAERIASMQSDAKDAELAEQTQATPRIPEVTELSPADFAALSRPVMPIPHDTGSQTTPLARSLRGAGMSSNQTVATPPRSTRLNVLEASYRADEQEAEPATPVTVIRDEDEKPNIVKRILGTLRKPW